ncbi:MAG: UvrD-helicase domain-containing protein [Firmicutes bacterium]|nr:UvrD-helicase domain-containing protein [Alicyclobacillaceae bacterium]MCL6497168.1 UvrD-helicase domain-containing protein [Bacillota bacterium]
MSSPQEAGAGADAPARHAATVRFDVDILVEAGAGTGKTTLLVDRAVQAVLGQALPLSALVLITFMERAAAEIRGRIEERLHAAAQSGGRVGALAQRALAELPKAPITTIHGLCRAILAEFGGRIGLPVPFEVLDGFDAERWWREAWRQWLHAGMRPSSVATFDTLIGLGLGEADLERLCRAASEAWPLERPAVAPPDGDRLVGEWLPVLERLSDQAREAALPDDPGAQQIAEWCEWLEAWAGAEERERWRRLIAVEVPARLAGNQRLWRPREALRQQKILLGQFFQRLSEAREAVATWILDQFLTVVAEDFVPFWRQWRWERRALTFDDLLRETHRLLHQVPEVRALLQRRWLQVMVDEFQDTDPLQVAIIWALVNPPEPYSSGGGRLFAVGDPKQSIYRFRGADVETYAEVAAAVEQRGGMRLAIVQNFRSDGAILAFVNRCFSGTEVPERPYWPRFDPLVAVRERPVAKPRVRVVGGPVAGTRDDRRRLEAHCVARLVQQAVVEGWPVFEPSGERPIRYGDIAVLVPARTGLEQFQAAFAECGVPLAALGSIGFFRQEVVRGFAALLRAVLDPDDLVAAAAWLMSPWVGLDLSALALSRLAVRESLAGAEAGPAGPWLRRLWTWSRRRFEWEAVDYFDAAVAETGLVDRLADAQDRQGLANLKKLRELARTRGSRWGLEGFCDWLYLKVLRQDPEAEAEVEAVGDVVKVSTIHRAKGLEWPMAVVANWHRDSARLGPLLREPHGTAVAWRLGGVKSRGWDVLEQAHRLREAAEAARLLYVALTRAREYLVVVDTYDPRSAPLLPDASYEPLEL